MTDASYQKLTRPQKLAILLILIGPEAAAGVLKEFDDAEAEVICREMAACSIIPVAVQQLVLEEFTTLIAHSVGSALGGVAYAQRTLELAKGDYKASAIIGRVGTVGTSNEVMREIAEMEARQIYNLVKHEEPQTIAFVLSYLDREKCAEVFALLAPEARDEVIERLGTIESTSLELAGKIARRLGRHGEGKARPMLHHSGGVHVTAELLNHLDKAMSKALLAKLEERNAPLGAAVRKRLFNFENFARLSVSDLQRVLREADSAHLALALKGVSEGLRERVFGSISKRAAESLKEEIEMLGSVRQKDVEAAQDSVIQVARRLEEEGQITLDPEAASTVA